MPSPATVLTGENALAESMLLTHDDFPTDYLEKQHKTTGDANPLNGPCGSDVLRDSSGKAISDDFLFDGQSPSITEVVVVYAGAQVAAAALTRLPAFVGCSIAAINQGVNDSTEVSYSGASSNAVTVTTGADETTAFELHAQGKLSGQVGGQVSDVYTVVFARKGRAVYEIFIRASGTSFPLDELSDIATNATARIVTSTP